MSKKFKNSVEFANTKLLLENYRNIQIAINCRGEDEIFSKNHTKISENFCVYVKALAENLVLYKEQT